MAKVAKKAKETRFKVGNLEADGGLLNYVITDTKTGVQYLLASSPGMGGGLTPLLDNDGKPLLLLDSPPPDGDDKPLLSQ